MKIAVWQIAINEAQKARGLVGHNPAVGAVVVRGNTIIAQGHTHAPGKNHAEIEVAFVLSNKADAKVLEEAQKLGVETLHFENAKVEDGHFLTQLCVAHDIDYIVLAGYLRKIPELLIDHYPEKIFNIHPALLPKFGGAGMYGKFVHEAVLGQQETETGISIHYVNAEFDSGRIIAQFRCLLSTEDTVTEVAQKVQQLEHAYLPVVIEKTILIPEHA